MTELITELKYKDIVYTITDKAAQTSLQTKADLVGGIVPKAQLPSDIITEDGLTDKLEEALQGIDLDDYLKVDVAQQTYLTKSEGENTYLSITAASDTYATMPYVSMVIQAANDYTDQKVATLTGDYNKLQNIPTINNKELKGSLTTADLGIIIPVMSYTRPVKVYRADVIANNNSIILDIDTCINSVVCAFSINTDNVEMFRPLFNDAGVSAISKLKQYVNGTNHLVLKLDLGAQILEESWETCNIYLMQALNISGISDTYTVGDTGSLVMYDNNADGNPNITGSVLSLKSDQFTEFDIQDDGILKITIK
jgi:hypothetical protein